MRKFLSSLLVLALLLFFCQTGNAGDSRAANVDLQPNHGVESDSDINYTSTKVGPWASLGIPSHIIQGLQDALPSPALRLMGAIRHFTAPQPSPSDFWDKAKEYEKLLQEYIPRMLTSAQAYFKSTAFNDITYAMKNIVHVTATFRSLIQDGLDAHGITLDTITQELEVIFMDIVHELEKIHPPSKAPGHAERGEMVNKVLNDTESALVNLAVRYGIKEDIVTTYLETVRPHVHALTVAVGDINEQHPQLLPTLAFSIAALLIPESWILRPFLSVFGFGPAGPGKGSAAAWLQSRFWGAAVKAESWFALLQAAGMGVIPKWTGVVIKAPLIVGGLLAMFLPCFRRG